MILDIVLAPILWVFDWFLSLFPTMEIPLEFTSAVTTFFDFFAKVNRYIPVNELFFCIATIFVVSNITVFIFIGNFLINKLLKLIPFIG